MPEQTENANVALIASKPVAPAVAPRASLREMLAILAESGLMDAMGAELVKREVAAALYDQDYRVARMFAASGYFSDIKGENEDQSIARAMTKMQLGRSWNMEPADAIQHIYLVNGRPAVQNEYLAAKMRDAGLDWDIEWMRTPDGGCIGCKLWPSRLAADGVFKPILERANGEQVPASVSFTKAQADNIKIKEGNSYIPLSEKATYQSYAEDMYFWRCIARLRRRYATNVLSGVLTRTEAEEIPPVEIQKALPAPVIMEPKVMPDMQPVKTARGRAGSKEIPGTGQPVAAPEPVVDVTAQSAPEVITTPPAEAKPTAAPEAKPAETAQEANPADDQVEKEHAENLRRVRAIGARHGEQWFVETLMKFSRQATPETISRAIPDTLKAILVHVEKADAAVPPQQQGEPRKGLF